MNEELKIILFKVRDLYNKYGIKSVTMDDVARELGISKKTIYEYVADKDELVGKFVENEIQVRHDEICKCFRSEWNAIEELFEISMLMSKIMREQNPATEHDLKKYYPHHYQKIVMARRAGILEYMIMNLKKGKKEGLYRDEINQEIMAKLYLSRVESIHLNDLYSVEEYTSNTIQSELLKYHVRGIATEKGIAILEKKIKDLNK